jgi:hypothetical protein
MYVALTNKKMTLVSVARKSSASVRRRLNSSAANGHTGTTPNIFLLFITETQASQRAVIPAAGTGGRKFAQGLALSKVGSYMPPT